MKQVVDGLNTYKIINTATKIAALKTIISFDFSLLFNGDLDRKKFKFYYLLSLVIR
jgi:hypothetical protein